MATFTADDRDFFLDGKPFRILAGAIHYFRVVPEYWKDRLLRLKACGLNTVETYVAWNAHEPEPGKFRFDGMLDLERFLRTAADLGLKALVRPGPYICSEWDFGGLPWWLLRDPGMKLRCLHEPYLAAVDRFYDRLFQVLAPLQCTKGGPIIAMQVENEYGSYGNDSRYLAHLAVGMRRRGADVLFLTSDGPTDFMLQGGTLPDVLKTANFGSNARESFGKLREYQPTGPLMCTEFWNGWFDHWGEKHHKRDVAEVERELDELLGEGASVSLYMLHGGTNFGFWNGANFDKVYQPTITSYDDDAPVGEAGDLRPKYGIVKRLAAKYGSPVGEPPPLPPRRAYGRVELRERVGLLAALPALAQPIRAAVPLTMEEAGQGYGFVAYRGRVTGPRPEADLILQDVHDRAHVFVDGKLAGVIERGKPSEVKVAVPAAGVELIVLVENMGRINYGPLLADRKGITEGIRLGNQFLYHWETLPLPLDQVSRIPFGREGGKAEAPYPAFFRGSADVSAPADTFLHLPGWIKGVVWVNGFNLGRYWNVGPQRSLYLPAPLIRKGRNEIVVLELHGCEHPVVELMDHEDIG